MREIVAVRRQDIADGFQTRAVAGASLGMLTHNCFNADTSRTMRQPDWGEVLGGDFPFRDALPTPVYLASECVLPPSKTTGYCVEWFQVAWYRHLTAVPSVLAGNMR